MKLIVNRIVHHIGGYYELRADPGVQGYLEDRAAAMAARANAMGKGRYATSSQQGQRRPQGRWRTTVITADFQSQLDNARNQTLLRSIDG